jgi:branched-chain amino acid transport system ATP-binding protein
VTDAPVLEAVDLRAGYEALEIVHGVSLTVPSGGFVSVIGPNGAGKSTLLKAIYGLASTLGGRVTFAGEPVTGRKAHELTRLGLNYVPQLDNVFVNMSVLENLEIGAVPRRERLAKRLEAVFGLFPVLAKRRRQRAGTLSGGERQMLALGRALMARPKLLMLDEPSLGLAPLVVREVFRAIAELRAAGVSLLLVEQNARAALQVADYGYVLETGETVLEGTARELLANPRVVETYLGLSGRAA